MFKATILSASALLSLACFGIATPLPSANGLPSGAVIPQNMFVLDESSPDSWLPVNGTLFQVAQNGGSNGATSRRYLLVHFPPTPWGSNGCELRWTIPADTQFVQFYGSSMLDVLKTTGYYPPWRPTWNSIIAGNPPTLGPGVFGTINAAPPADAYVNSEACSNGPPPGAVGGGYGLAFVFKFPQWVEQSGNPAAVSFYLVNSAPGGAYRGPYVTVGQ